MARVIESMLHVNFILRARLVCSGQKVSLLFALPSTWDSFLARNDCIMLRARHVCSIAYQHAIQTRYVSFYATDIY